MAPSSQDWCFLSVAIEVHLVANPVLARVTRGVYHRGIPALDSMKRGGSRLHQPAQTQKNMQRTRGGHGGHTSPIPDTTAMPGVPQSRGPEICRIRAKPRFGISRSQIV